MSGLMNMVSRFAKGSRGGGAVGRGRGPAGPGMGGATGAGMGGGSRGRGGSGLESIARRFLRRR